MAELFLLILTGVVFCAWLNHKTGFLKDIEIDNTSITQDDWFKQLEEDLDNDINVPGSYSYNYYHSSVHNDD